MTKKEQQKIKLQQAKAILEILPQSNSIRDVSKKTGISESTIQNILHQPTLIAEALVLNNDLETIKQINIKINEWFKKNKYEGFRRGAIISQSISKNHPKIRKR